jgi:hypothetical protein
VRFHAERASKADTINLKHLSGDMHN